MGWCVDRRVLSLPALEFGIMRRGEGELSSFQTGCERYAKGLKCTIQGELAHCTEGQVFHRQDSEEVAKKVTDIVTYINIS